MLKALLVSDYNLANFSAILANNEAQPRVTPFIAPLGQVMQVLIDPNMPCRKEDYDFAVCWTLAHNVISSYARVLNNESVHIDNILAQVDDYARAVIALSHTVKTVFVPLWVDPFAVSGNAILDFKEGAGRSVILLQMNSRLAQHFQNSANVHILDTQKWVSFLGRASFNPKLWYMGKIAFTNELFNAAVNDIKTALQTIHGHARKLLVVDLDDTLWGGVVGDVGWQNIALGGHDAVGEAYRDFQMAVKALKNRGIILAIASKNEEAVALEAIKNNTEMVLKLEDFSAYRINWQDKAKNICELTEQLNLGLQSVVFIDDNPVERARVKEALGSVLVPDWPSHPMLYKGALLALNCFDAVAITGEDRERTIMYEQENKREGLKNQIGSVEEWIKSLDIKISVEELSEKNITRSAQLLNKTNQMNLSTRRLAEAELLNWSRQGENKVFVFRVEDKFGDYGLTGLASLSFDGGQAKINDYLLSCRVMGRHVEEAMIYVLVAYAKKQNARMIIARYLPTEKNKPCLDFWHHSGFRQEGGEFIFDCSFDYLRPQGVTLNGGQDVC